VGGGGGLRPVFTSPSCLLLDRPLQKLLLARQQRLLSAEASLLHGVVSLVLELLWLSDPSFAFEVAPGPARSTDAASFQAAACRHYFVPLRSCRPGQCVCWRAIGPTGRLAAVATVACVWFFSAAPVAGRRRRQPLPHVIGLLAAATCKLCWAAFFHVRRCCSKVWVELRWHIGELAASSVGARTCT